MNRHVAADYAVLCQHLGSYTLATAVGNPAYLAAVKRMHKQYLAALTFVTEAHYQNGALSGPGSRRKRATLDYFKESVSDLGSAVVCFLHGVFKPSRLMLRSSLETTAKGIAAFEGLAILKDKNVFNVLSAAKATALISEPTAKRNFARLETRYQQLCKFVHTAGLPEMAHISAWAALGNYQDVPSAAVADSICDTAKIVITLQALQFREEYNAMHYSNREIVRDSLSIETRRRLAGV